SDESWIIMWTIRVSRRLTHALFLNALRGSGDGSRRRIRGLRPGARGGSRSEGHGLQAARTNGLEGNRERSEAGGPGGRPVEARLVRGPGQVGKGQDEPPAFSSQRPLHYGGERHMVGR